MTIDEKASLFSDLFSMEECVSLAHKSVLSPHMYANRASYANGPSWRGGGLSNLLCLQLPISYS